MYAFWRFVLAVYGPYYILPTAVNIIRAGRYCLITHPSCGNHVAYVPFGFGAALANDLETRKMEQSNAETSWFGDVAQVILYLTTCDASTVAMGRDETAYKRPKRHVQNTRVRDIVCHVCERVCTAVGVWVYYTRH